MKESIEHWNKGTNRWLRSIVYERMKCYRLVLTYTLSAVWHGFYPGYYLTFANGAFFTIVARTVSEIKLYPLYNLTSLKIHNRYLGLEFKVTVYTDSKEIIIFF